jgi:hypothetical protein
LTGADPQGFHLQLNALRNLKKAGVSAHPSVMISFSGREEIDRLYSTIWKIDPILHSEIEKEEVILYPYVVEKLKRAGLEYYSGHIPEKKEGKRRNVEKAEREIPRIVERGARSEEQDTSHGEKAVETDQRPSIPGKDPKIRIKRGTGFP